MGQSAEHYELQKRKKKIVRFLNVICGGGSKTNNVELHRVFYKKYSYENHQAQNRQKIKNNLRIR